LPALIDRRQRANLSKAERNELAETLPQDRRSLSGEAKEMSKLGKELIGSAREALAIARGEGRATRVFSPAAPDVAAIRKRLGLSQDRFAKKFGLSPATVRDWEQGRRQPDAPARNFLRVIDYAPETVERAIVRAEAEAR